MTHIMEGRKARRYSLSIDQDFNYKNHVFLAIECSIGPLSAPPSSRHVQQKSPRHSSLHMPLLDRPSCSFKNMGISQNLGISLNFMSHQKVSAPPCAPPCFIIVKFMIRAQTFPITIFYENAFPGI